MLADCLLILKATIASLDRMLLPLTVGGGDQQKLEMQYVNPKGEAADLAKPFETTMVKRTAYADAAIMRRGADEH